jgi:hypothetical protein
VQVAKHMEKQQKEKEARAMERLHLLLPALGPTVRAVALQECNWDEERALTMLRRFQVNPACVQLVHGCISLPSLSRPCCSWMDVAWLGPSGSYCSKIRS